jgi:hypothetical protein
MTARQDNLQIFYCQYEERVHPRSAYYNILSWHSQKHLLRYFILNYTVLIIESSIMLVSIHPSQLQTPFRIYNGSDGWRISESGECTG